MEASGFLDHRHGIKHCRPVEDWSYSAIARESRFWRNDCHRAQSQLPGLQIADNNFSISYRLLLASRSRGLYGKVYRNNRASEPALRLFMLSPRAELFSVGCALPSRGRSRFRILLS